MLRTFVIMGKICHTCIPTTEMSNRKQKCSMGIAADISPKSKKKEHAPKHKVLTSDETGLKLQKSKVF